MIALYDYQDSLTVAVRRAFQAGYRAPLLVLPTGAGKTVCFTWMAEQAQARGKRVLILVHRKELVSQTSAALALWGVAHGIISGSAKPSRHPVQVAMVQTLANRVALDKTGRFKFDLIIIDEAHHATLNSGWAKVLAHNPKAKLLGVTATPVRLDGKGLGIEAQGFFDVLICGPSAADLVARGRLVRSVVYAPAQSLDLSMVASRGGDYVTAQLAAAVDKAAITGDAVAHYSRYAADLAAIAFTITVAHGGHVVEQFKQAGIAAALLTGATPAKERAQLIKDLGAGQLKVLASCNVVSEGTDIPKVAAALLLRPTASYGLAMQQIGRALRTAPGKDKAIILDHAGNVLRHGLPTDEVEWSLQGMARPHAKGAALVKACKGCGALLSVKASSCLDCHVVCPAVAPRDELVSVADGELVELTAEQLASLKAQKRQALIKARTKEQLVSLGKERNYQYPALWADKIIAGRMSYRAQQEQRT